jgi:CheY-like chemotaxis protein
LRILIIDDHPINLKLLRLTLQSHNHEVREASDGAEGLKILGAGGINSGPMRSLKNRHLRRNSPG